MGKNKKGPLISDTYTDDYDIAFVDILVRRRLEEQRLELPPRLHRKALELEREIAKPQTILERQISKDRKARLLAEALRFSSGQAIREYEQRVEPLLQRYREQKPEEQSQILFCISGVQRVRSGSTCWERVNLIKDYIAIANEYVPLDICRVALHRSGCVACGAPIETEILTTFDHKVCSRCGAEQMQLITTKVSKDSARTVASSEKQDESIKNFLKAFDNYQGIETERIPDELYEALDAYFATLRKPTGAQVRALPLNERGRRGETDSQMLWHALQETGYNAYYRHSNKIAKEYWGWVLPNVQSLRDIIIEDYHKTQAVFHKIPPEERSRESALGTEYRLWRHLQMRGHECYMDEFRIARDSRSLRIHNTNWRKMVEGVGEPDVFRYIE